MRFSACILAGLLATVNIAAAVPIADPALAPRADAEPETRGGQVYISES